MNYNRPRYRGSIRLIHTVIDIIACIFCYCFLWKVQGGMLGMAQHILSAGQTVYYPPVGAFTLTVVFFLLQKILSRFLRLEGEWYALSYFLPYLLLAILTSVDASLYTQFTWGAWVWLAPLSLVVFGVLIWLGKNLEEMSEIRGLGLEVRLLIPNLLMLVIFSCLTVWASYTDKVFHNQVEMEYALSQGMYDKATQIGKYTTQTNPTTVALRNYALGRSGELGERLFEFEQPYGAEGLWISRADSLHMLFSPDSIYHSLGAYPSEHSTTALQYLEYLDQSPKQRTDLSHQYLLCALLLEKKLPEFVQLLEKDHAITDSIEYPRHFQEALVLYKHRFNPDLNYQNVVQETNYSDYDDLVQSAKTSEEEYNWTKKDFHSFYWWYYDYYTTRKK